MLEKRLLATPVQFTGISLGMNTLLRIVESSIGHALAGVYIQMYQSTIKMAGESVTYPSMQAFSIIFMTAAMRQPRRSHSQFT